MQCTGLCRSALRIPATRGARPNQAYCCRAAIKKGVQTMRLHINRDSHDPRQIDLVAVIALLVVVFVAICYLGSPALTPTATTFIEPSQTVR